MFTYKKKQVKAAYLLLMVFTLAMLFNFTSGKSSAQPIQGEKWALVIGISEYEKVSNLQFADDDAKAMYSLLVTKAGFSQDHVKLLLDGQATKRAVLNAIGFLLQAAPRDLVLIYFSGHGYHAKDKNGDEGDGFDEFLVPYDADTEDSASWILDDEIPTWFQWFAGRVVFIVDSIYSAGFNDLFALNSSHQRENKMLLASSRENESSSESPQLGHGIFTYFLLEALRGAADLNKDGIITLGEAFDYTKSRMIRFIAKHNLSIQAPVMISTIKGEVPITIR